MIAKWAKKFMCLEHIIFNTQSKKALVIWGILMSRAMYQIANERLN